ncbi:MAG: SLC13 family permease, partial [Verrucomicrobiota bacterium]
EAIDVILFVLVIGGFIGVFQKTGAFDAGMNALVVRLRGREDWLIIIVTALISLGGTTFGLAEETLAFYPLLVPIFLAAGYDVMVPVAVIFIGTSVGSMASTVNPFAIIIASNAAGISWTSALSVRAIMWTVATGISIAYILRYARKVRQDPSLSLAPAPGHPPAMEFESDETKKSPGGAAAPSGDVNNGGGAAFLASSTGLLNPSPQALTKKMRLLLVVFALSFAVMIFGVSRLGWWFPEMTTLFFAAALVIGIIERPGEKKFVEWFIAGAQQLLGVGLIIGIARGATLLLDKGEVSGTILNYLSGQVAHMPGAAFIVGLLFVYIVLSIFIQSSSGMAVLTMPIMSALAEVAGVPRDQIVNAFCWGIGLMGFIAPTGLVLPSLAMVNVRFDKWVRFIWPLIAILTVLSIIFLVLGVLIRR